jgi:hypothetical protein
MVIAAKAVESVMEAVIAEAVESVMESEAAVEVKRTIEPRIPVVEVAPGPNADEHSVHEIAWTPVTIRCAVIRIIGIKAVFAHRRRIVITVAWPDLDAERNLRL